MGRFRVGFLVLLLLAAIQGFAARKFDWSGDSGSDGDGLDERGTARSRWAVLIAGSSGYWNYRHQADVCHAYQLLRRGGMRKENIVVFMYDDIAHNFANPRPGVMINHPDGDNVYEDIPKDYTGDQVTVNNFLAVLRGDKDALQGGGSGKVVESGPNDHIFVFYSDHGGPGVLGMPTGGFLYAVDLVSTLQYMHENNKYSEMVLYIEACESGSVFEGLLPDNLNIFVTTASNAIESSWGTYCPGMVPAPPPEYDTCIGDLYSVAWMEDSEVHNLDHERLKDQYNSVKRRTSDSNTYRMGSHVMKYGDTKMDKERLSLYLGFDPANANLTSYSGRDVEMPVGLKLFLQNQRASSIAQRDADLLHFWQKYKNSKENSLEKSKALQEFLDVIGKRTQVDRSVELVGRVLLGSESASQILNSVRPEGHPLVDDWDCLKKTVRVFESECGPLGQYGMKHMRTFANLCNAGVNPERMKSAAGATCGGISSNTDSWEGAGHSSF